MELKHAVRLIKLANYLGNMPNKNWDYWTIFVKKENHTDGKIKSCGSVGCAIGHCPQLFSNCCQYDDPYNYYEDNKNTQFTAIFDVIGKGNFKGLDGIKFSEKFFGLTNNEALQLFWGDGGGLRIGDSKKEVIQSIVNLVKSKGFKVAWVAGQRVCYKMPKIKQIGVNFVSKN